MAEDKQELTPTVEKKAKKKLSGKQKGLIAVVVVAVVILLVGIAGYVVTHVNSYAFYNKVVIALAPVKTNPNYDQKKAPNEPMFICYYKDASGKEVDLPGGTYKENGNNGQVLIAFLGKAAEKVVAIQKTITIIFWVLVAVAVCVLIYIWYRLDARYEERQMLAAHGGREKDKKKHKN